MEPVVVVLDPFHPYAAAFISTCYQHLGLRSVCLYTARGERFKRAGSEPILRGDAVAAHYLVDLGRPAEVAEHLARRHDVRAFIPHDEPHVLPAVRLADELGLGWIDPRTMALFRDKHALKAAVRAAGRPRMNASTLVQGVDDVQAAVDDGQYGQFVLKPNSGMGNHAIGFFEARDSRSRVEAYFQQAPPGPVVMEEFLEGQEYCVNGQVDSRGWVQTLSVMRTRHVAANGRPQLALGFELVRRAEPVFDTLSGYAAEVLTVLGLVRSPFHMEVMVDERGPCLIEVAARMAGAGQARTTAIAHGHSLDPFLLAASGYTGLDPDCPSRPDWDAYDTRLLRTVCGVSDSEQRIVCMRGVAEVTAMAEFVEWVFLPHVGQRAHVTRDLVSAPWLVTLAAVDGGGLERAEEQVRAALVWNPPQSMGRTLASHAHALTARVRTHLRGVPELVRVRPEVLVPGQAAPSAATERGST